MDIDETHQRIQQLRAMLAAGIGLNELWVAYRQIGGVAGILEVEAYIYDILPLPPRERDCLAYATNSLIDRLPAPLPRAACRDDFLPKGQVGPVPRRPE